MTEELENDAELECERFLREKGLPVSDLVLSDYQRWALRLDDFEVHKWDVYKQFEVRHEFIREFGFAILTRKAIEAIRPHAPLVELGAGSGYWSYELRKRGVDIIPTDDFSGKYGFFKKETVTEWKNDFGSLERIDIIPEETTAPCRWRKHYLEPEKLDALDAVKKYPGHNLLLVWPDYDESWAAEALSIFTGSTVIFMGESAGGCTGDDRFHELLNMHFTDQKYVQMPQFWGLHDELIIARRAKQLT